jgi:P450-derived glycosyltransferase activator
MNAVTQTARFAAGLYAAKAGSAFAGYVKRDELALLSLRPGRADPYAIYERLRARGPLTPTRLGNWATTSHRICDAVLRDRRFGFADGTEEGFNLSFLEMNPPDHTRLRRLATPSFSPKAVASYAGRIEKVVGGLLDSAAAAGEFDLVSAFASPLPIAVISELLGVPETERSGFAQYGAVIGSALDGIASLRHAAQLKAANTGVYSLFESLFELRRREPRDDIISHLMAAEGDQIKSGEMLPLCGLLLVAGFETTVNLIGNGMLALLSHPEQWRALCADPAAMAPKAVEEILRYDSPVQLTSRTALEPAELDGNRIGRGQFVVILLGAANRDPEVYDRPAEFDITREHPAPHLAFSSGIHYCLGQPLARLEATIAFRLLAERMPNLRQAGRVKRRNTTTIRGPVRLPVRP